MKIYWDTMHAQRGKCGRFKYLQFHLELINQDKKCNRYGDIFYRTRIVNFKILPRPGSFSKVPLM